MATERPGFEDESTAKEVVSPEEQKIGIDKEGNFFIEHKGKIFLVSSMMLVGLLSVYSRNRKK